MVLLLLLLLVVVYVKLIRLRFFRNMCKLTNNLILVGVGVGLLFVTKAGCFISSRRPYRLWSPPVFTHKGTGVSFPDDNMARSGS